VTPPQARAGMAGLQSRCNHGLGEEGQGGAAAGGGGGAQRPDGWCDAAAGKPSSS
jgi:hypothetical protein